MSRPDPHRQRRRDLALRRLRRTNQMITGAATALLVAFAAIAARGFSGHPTAQAATARATSTGTGAVPHGRRQPTPVARRLARPNSPPRRPVHPHHARHPGRRRRATPSATATSSTTTSVATTPAPVVSGGS